MTKRPLKYVGSAIDEAYLNFYREYTDFKKIMHGEIDNNVIKYQKNKYYESDVEEIADAIIAERIFNR